MISQAPDPDGIVVRRYDPTDEQAWLRCRVLAFLDTAFYDSVERRKPAYDAESIELVAVRNGEMAGLIDMELEREPGTLGLPRDVRAAVIWSIATHPDHRRKGVARTLLHAAAEQARAAGMSVVEAWTRDDQEVRDWYERMGFVRKANYLHVFLEGGIESGIPGMTIRQAFAHYTGPDPDGIRARFNRVHECCAYELRL